MEINIFVCHHPLPSLFIICMKIMIILVRVVVVVARRDNDVVQMSNSCFPEGDVWS